MDPLALLAIAMLTPAGIWGLWEGGTRTAMLVLPLIGTPVLLMYLAGPAAFVAVTRTHVVVGNPLVKYSVPRSLTGGVRIDGFSIELRVSGHSPIPIAALTPGVGGHNRVRPGGYQTRLNRIARLLDHTPATLMAGTMVRRYRYVHLVLLALDVLALVGMVLYISTEPFTTA
ncbi:hypothetical protein O7600_11235 [Micromonospora sp. WMMA1998]|uniref:hypothetical protein n=1 Tax=Micromonospora sp. WMMA1998 TaxID=3015167 RepID=UPI00248BBF23|nr:hypothetical protein [Micromonospora sp. WMMA1998]WBC17363.1 hypothetical protein O7600_11235 [Micromonospora sp. WMMA1998]